MDSASSAFSRLSLGTILTPPGTSINPNSLSSSIDLFRFNKFVSETLDSGLRIIEEDDFEKVKFLGSGKTMSTYAGRWKSRSCNVALKYLNFVPSISDSSIAARDPEFQSILRAAALELRVLQHEVVRSHPNIVDILCVSWHHIATATGAYEIYPILIMELACPEYPTLGDLVRNENVKLPLSDKLSLLYDVFAGICVLHGLSVVHGDLKPENILIFRNSEGKFIAKISDFGFSQAESPSQGVEFEAGGTEYWNAPECLRNAPETLAKFKKTEIRDIYSYGLLACFVLLGELPFAEQRWTVPQISSMKLKDGVSGLFASRWAFRSPGQTQDPNQWKDLTSHITDGLQEEQLVWRVRLSTGWHQEEVLPLRLLKLIPKMLQMEPTERPNKEDIVNSLRSCTSPRVEVYKASIAKFNDTMPSFAQAQTSVMGTRMARSHLCDPSIPNALRHLLFQSFLAVARGADSDKRDEAMVNIGFCMIKAFGTRYDLSEAMVWFARAGVEGNITGQEMVFRLERKTKQNSIGLVPGLTRRVRTSWIVRCLLRDLDTPRVKSYGPDGFTLEMLRQQLLDVFLKFDPELVENGLQRAVDDYIVKIPAMIEVDITQDPVLGPLPGICSAIAQDDPVPIHRFLTTNLPMVSEVVKDALIVAAGDKRSSNILRSLIYDHKFPIDKSFEKALVRAFMRSDLQISGLLLDIGVPWAIMLNSSAVNETLKGCSIPAAEMVLGLQNLLEVDEETVEYPPYWRWPALRQEHMDGIQPVMGAFPFRGQAMDNYSPPIFEMVARNRPLNLGFVLALGGNPNIRYMGMTALHLSVKLLRPVLVAMLLACGADPNARDFRNGLETPLHQISGEHYRPIYQDDNEFFDYYDIFGDRFIPTPPFSNEEDHNRRLIIHLLIEYGAEVNALSGEGWTPFMKAIMSPSSHAPMVTRYLIEMGADPFESERYGLSPMHVASMKGDLQLLRYLLSLPRGSNCLNQRSLDGVTPLHAACGKQGPSRMIIELLEAGADVSIRTNAGLNALSLAMRHSHKEIFSVLIEHVQQLPPGARDDIVLVNPITGATAAHDSLASQEPLLISYFLQKLIPLMSDLHRTDLSSTAPLHLAVIKKNIPAIELLLKNGAKINAKGSQGMTPLHLACGLGEPVLVDFLISWGGNKHIKNDFDLTPEEFGLISKRDPTTMDHYFETLNRTRSVLAKKEPIEKLELEAASFKRQLIEDSQYASGDPFTKAIPGLSSSLTEIEYLHLQFLELSISRNGDKHLDSIWRMNNLGCVYERYGRLSRAEEIYRKGWKLSLEVLGTSHFLVADFANKLMRVLQDFGRGDSDQALKQWIVAFGQDTLNRPFLAFQYEPDREKFDNITSHPKHEVKGTCDRRGCENPSQLTCLDCQVFRYCSEFCREPDWRDPESSHRKKCIHSLTAEENLAIVTQRLAPTDTHARDLTNFIFDTLTSGFEPSDLGDNVPTVISAHMVLYNPKTFRTPCRFRTTKNMVIMFLSDGGFNYLLKSTTSEWETPSNRFLMLLYGEEDFWVAPLPANHQGKHGPPRSTAVNSDIGANMEMFVMVEYIYLDFPKAQERRARRLRGGDIRINLLPCYYSGHPDV